MARSVSEFFQVGHEYRIHNVIFSVKATVDSVFGPLAWATFHRGPGLDVQTLCMAQYEEAEEVGWGAE